ncbi:MAG: hypothetical protein AB1758_10110 [Candidatus Eremiobacterota bacterium]
MNRRTFCQLTFAAVAAAMSGAANASPPRLEASYEASLAENRLLVRVTLKNVGADTVHVLDSPTDLWVEGRLSSAKGRWDVELRQPASQLMTRAGPRRRWIPLAQGQAWEAGAFSAPVSAAQVHPPVEAVLSARITTQTGAVALDGRTVAIRS